MRRISQHSWLKGTFIDVLKEANPLREIPHIVSKQLKFKLEDQMHGYLHQGIQTLDIYEATEIGGTLFQ